MKKLLFICITLFAVNANAQAPEKMSYQAVVRNTANVLVTNQSVGMRISILQGSVAGTAVYVETQTATTNTNGLVSLEIGTGTIVTGTFAAINWAVGLYFIKTETDPTGGTAYSIIGTSQLLSTPYALYAKTSGSSTPGPQGLTGNDGAIGATGPQGNTGATGPSGTVTIVSFNGGVGAGPFNNMTAYNFVGPTATITITSTTQKVYGTAVAPIALAAGLPVTDVRLGLGYKLGAAGAVTNFAGVAYAIVQLSTLRSGQPVAGYVTGLTPGTYTVGIVILNSTANAVSNNDFVNGWVTVAN